MPGRAASDMRSGVAVAGGNLAFVGGEGGKNFVRLGFRDLEDRQGPSEFRCNLVEFCGRDPQIPVRLLKPERCGAGLGGGKLVGAAGNIADLQRPHELEAGQPAQVSGVPLAQLRVRRLLADDRVLHDSVAEMIHHRSDGEDAAQPLVQAVLRHGFLLLCGCVIRR